MGVGETGAVGETATVGDTVALGAGAELTAGTVAGAGTIPLTVLATQAAATLDGNPTSSSGSVQAFTIQGLTDISAPSQTLDWLLAVNHTTEPFWEAAKQRRLVAPQCADCGSFRMPPTPF